MRFIIAIFIVVTGCTPRNSEIPAQITLEEYQIYLPIVKSDSLEIANILSPLEADASFIDLGKEVGILLDLFDQNGDIRLLNLAAKYQEQIARDVVIKKEKYLRTLAQIYIMQHRFVDADSVITLSRKISDSRQNKYVAFDLSMELGEYTMAAELLESFRQENDFNYLIRVAKWKDYKGELSRTIAYMLKAEKLAEAEANLQKLVWVYTNLGDYYGHDNQIDQSYRFYLKALKLDSKNIYALKKIAFIHYAYEHDYDKAIAILDEIQKVNQAPDIDLLKAEILSVNGQSELALQSLSSFEDKVTSNHYHNMYNGYLIKHLIRSNRAVEALSLSRKELENRSTPETYSWLAAGLLATDNKQQSLQVIKSEVAGKTHEPEALLISAQVHKANGLEKEALKIKEELVEASFELGPSVMQGVNSL